MSGEVIGGHRERELPIDLEQAAMPHLAQAGHGLGPAESLLDAFADALRDRIAGMTGGALVDRRAAAICVLRNVRVTAWSRSAITKSALSSNSLHKPLI
jgi:hypothetical protein